VEADTGATAADVVAALRTIGIDVSAEDVAEHWDDYQLLAALFNANVITDD
jgi:hypothetical protein